MAIQNHLFLSKTRQSIGNLTFSSWKNIGVVKKKIEKNGSNTPKQQKQRSAFMLVTRIVQPLNPILKNSFRPYTSRMTGYNACLGYNLKNALTEGPDGFEIDFSKVLIGRGGKLLSPVNATFVQELDNNIEIRWVNNSNDIGTANPNDKAIVVLYNETQGVAHLSHGDVERKDVSTFLSPPASWNSSDKIHVYLTFVSDDNSATSIYLSTYNVI